MFLPRQTSLDVAIPRAARRVNIRIAAVNGAAISPISARQEMALPLQFGPVAELTINADNPSPPDVGLPKGACLNLEVVMLVVQFRTVDCSAYHAYEYLGSEPYVGGSASDDAGLDQASIDFCVKAINEYLGGDYQEPFNFQGWRPSDAAQDGELQCVLIHNDDLTWNYSAQGVLG